MTTRQAPGADGTSVAPTELVARIRAGDGRAEEELVERYGRAVRVILRQLLRGGPEAEDFFQDTFRMALEKIRRGEVREPQKLASFVAGLARNVAIDHFRIKTRRRTDCDSETVARVARSGPDQLGSLLLGEKTALVRKLIGELPTDRDRQVLYRFYIAEEEKEQICDDLGLSSLHFNRVLHRARQRYRQLYESVAGREVRQAGAPSHPAPG